MNKNLKDKINYLKEERNAIILAHNYQIDEVQAIADYTGDSLGLSRKAATAEAEVIVFAGVDFMAESAAILSPEKTILLPARNAGCPMADMITVEGLRKKKEEYPDATVVCYANSLAAVKAESDICCTSSNALNIVEELENDRILFVPDQNLGQYVDARTDKEIILWDGYCRTHHRVQVTDVEAVRSAYPDSSVIVHPECRPEVVELADYVGSTAQILDFAQRSEEEKIIIGTEMGILYGLEGKSNSRFLFIKPKFGLSKYEDDFFRRYSFSFRRNAISSNC